MIGPVCRSSLVGEKRTWSTFRFHTGPCWRALTPASRGRWSGAVDFANGIGAFDEVIRSIGAGDLADLRRLDQTHPLSPTGSAAGMGQQTSDALARRSAQRQAGFLLPLLERGASLLDCGCGPGSISCDLARHVAPGTVTGIDADPAQVERASARAVAENLDNVSFQLASIYDLPFAAGCFEVVFAHAIFQHLADPDRAIREMRRVLAPSGVIAVRSPDWGALLVAPRTPALTAALDTFLDAYYANGDAFAGRNGPGLLRRAGCKSVTFSATVEHENPADLGLFAATKLMAPEHAAEAACLRAWASDPDALFAQVWGETIAR